MTSFYGKANKAMIEFSPYDHREMDLDHYRQLDPCRPENMARVVARVSYKHDGQYSWTGLLGINDKGEWVRWDHLTVDYDDYPKVLLS